MERGTGRPASLRFWGTALVAALLVGAALAAAVPLILRLEPRGGFWLLSRGEIWLLATFTGGVLAILLGLSAGTGGWLRASRLRERLEAWRRSGAGDEGEAGTPREDGLEAAPAERAPAVEEEGFDPAWWTVAVGLWLLGLYFAGWWILDPPA